MGKTLFTDNTDLTRDKQITFLSQDVVATGSTIRVQSIVGFESLTTSSGQIICIGNIGDEKTEILRTSDTTTYGPTYNELPLYTNLKFDHPSDTPVYIIDWDRVDVQHASTVSGTKSTLVAYPYYITPDQANTNIVDNTQTSGYYFTRFNNTINGINSSWSDAIPYAGYDDNTVFSIKQRAIDELGEEIDGKVITHEFLDTCLWQARREYHESPGKRPFRRNYNTQIGFVTTGSYRIDLPSDVERPYSAENIYGVRIGTQPNLGFYGKKDWDFDFRNKPHSTLDLPYTANTSTSIWLANGRDFNDSAVISVEGTNIGLSRVTGETGSFYIYSHGDWDCSAGSDVFENVSAGLPTHFTVWANPGGSAYIYFDKPFSTNYVNQNIWADYYRTLPSKDSDADTLDEPDYDMYVHYLKAKIKQRKSKGEMDITKDSDFQQWQLYKGIALSKEYGGVEITLTPGVEHLDYRNYGK